MGQAPEFLRRHGSKILVGLLLILAVIVFVRYRADAAQREQQLQIDALARISSSLVQLERLPATVIGPQEQAATRSTLVNDITVLINDLLASDDPEIQAQALLARGNLNWTLAQLPPIPGATTQPALALAESDEALLEKAAADYQRILENYSQNEMAQMNARFSLAAIDETLGRWEQARERYEAVLASDEALPTHIMVAQRRLEILDTIRQPVRIAPPATQPAPTVDAPAELLQPDAPATQPVAPATQPTTTQPAGS